MLFGTYTVQETTCDPPSFKSAAEKMIKVSNMDSKTLVFLFSDWPF